MSRYFTILAFLTLLLGLFPNSQAYAQDERFFRDLFSGRLKKDRPPGISDAKYNVAGPFYQIDLTENKRTESLVYEKRDGQDWIHIHDYNGERVYSYRFDTKGINARLYRVNLRRLSPMTNVLLLYFYEGYTSYLEFQGSARVYFLTIDNRDLSSLSMYQGPAIWEEAKSFRQGYRRRKYEVSLKDLSRDSVREIIVRSHAVTRVYKYLSTGRWEEF